MRPACLLFYTLYSSERDEEDVYTASSPNDTQTTSQLGRNFKNAPFFVAVTITQVSRSSQPEIMTDTKEPRRPNNEVTVKINV